MKRRLSQAISSLIIAVLSLLAPVPAAYGFAGFPHTNIPTITKYSAIPSEGRAGQEYDLIISSNNKDCQSSHELSQAQLLAPQGVPIAILTPSTQAPCQLTTRIKVTENAAVGKLVLWVGKDKESPIGIVEFSVVDNIPPGLIPPGVNPPAVDVMWSVMPRHIVSDNFGRAIAKEYYAVEIIIGNNSAYTLQLVTVGFELPSDRTLLGLVARNVYNKQLKSANQRQVPSLKEQLTNLLKTTLDNPADQLNAERKTLLPTSSYKITRGTLESKQLTHTRTLILSTITALGPIFTGFTPYFHNVNHRSNFSEAINIFSNPLEKGLELAWPDQRPRQRERFDDQVLRDGLIVRNNTQVRTLAFFPKELLRLPKDVENPEQYNSWKDNAREIRERLGEIVIVGDLIQYVNRISLIPNPPAPVVAPPIALGISPNRILQGASATFTITGSNFQGAQLVVSGGASIHVIKLEVDSTGHVMTADIKVDDTVAPGVYRLVVATPSSIASEGVNLFIEPEVIKVPDALIYEQKPPGNTVQIEAKGTYLHNAHFRMATSPENSIEVQNEGSSPDGKSLKAKLVVPPTAAPKTYKVEIVDDNKPDKVITKEFVVKAP